MPTIDNVLRRGRDGKLPWRLLACDYDETIATKGAMSPAAAEALHEARAAGWRTALVTGRPLANCQEVCRDFSCFDLVVAESGAVLHFPSTGATEDLVPPPPPDFVRELDRRGVRYLPGRVVVIVLGSSPEAVGAIIRDAGLALDYFWNRYAVMVVPRGTSKATGLRTALARIGVRPEEVVAFGDDENDRPLFEVAGLKVAVGNAIDAIKAAADVTLEKPNGEGVAEFIRERLLAGGPPSGP